MCSLVEMCSVVRHSSGKNAGWNSINNHWLIQKHHIIENNSTDWITFVTKELGDTKHQNNNLITFQANDTYLITTPHGFGLHGDYELKLKNAEQFDWVHLAFCLKGGTPSKVVAKYIFQNNDLMGSAKTKSESEVIKEFPEATEALIEVDSLAELKLNNRISWHFDKRNGWMHVKLVERANRRVGGTVHAKMIVESESYSYNASDYYKCSPEYGCLRISFDLNETTVDANIECDPFSLDVDDNDRIELCSECNTHDDCGEWQLNHMKCRQSRCVCGDNWLSASGSSHCRLLNTHPAPSYEQFTPEMCDGYETCDEQLEQCLIQCNDGDDVRCPQICLREHVVCENS